MNFQGTAPYKHAQPTIHHETNKWAPHTITPERNTFARRFYFKNDACSTILMIHWSDYTVVCLFLSLSLSLRVCAWLSASHIVHILGHLLYVFNILERKRTVLITLTLTRRWRWRQRQQQQRQSNNYDSMEQFGGSIYRSNSIWFHSSAGRYVVRIAHSKASNVIIFLFALLGCAARLASVCISVVFVTGVICSFVYRVCLRGLSLQRSLNSSTACAWFLL